MNKEEKKRIKEEKRRAKEEKKLLKQRAKEEKKNKKIGKAVEVAPAMPVVKAAPVAAPAKMDIKPVESVRVAEKEVEAPVEEKKAIPTKVEKVEMKVEEKPAEVKPVEVKPVEVKPVEVKPVEVKPVEKPAPASVAPAQEAPAEKKMPVKKTVKEEAPVVVEEAPVEEVAAVESEETAKKTTTLIGHFVYYKTDKGGFAYRLKASNNETIAVCGGAYSSLSACKIGINSVKKNAFVHIEDLTLKKPMEVLANPKYEIYLDKAGKFRYRLYASNGEIIAIAEEGYATKATCKNGIASIGRTAPDAEIISEAEFNKKADKDKKTAKKAK